jgi:hypothetical protein
MGANGLAKLQKGSLRSEANMLTGLGITSFSVSITLVVPRASIPREASSVGSILPAWYSIIRSLLALACDVRAACEWALRCSLADCVFPGQEETMNWIGLLVIMSSDDLRFFELLTMNVFDVRSKLSHVKRISMEYWDNLEASGACLQILAKTCSF